MEDNRVQIATYHQTRELQPQSLEAQMRATVTKVMAQGHTNLVKAVVAWCHLRLQIPTPLSDTECEVFHQILLSDPTAFDSPE